MSSKPSASIRTGAMGGSAVLLLFIVTIFLGAVLVFGVQPIAARLLLPRFGGSPGVWSAASLFFQLALLAGYGYSFLLTCHVTQRYQPLIHVPLLAMPLLLLPLSLPISGQPATDATPAISVLGVLAVGLGIPFAVASTTGPLLQRWFSYTGHRSGSDPYFLYAASNTGSLLVLLAYPFLLEPRLTLDEQSIAWSVGYAVFAFLGATCAVVMRRRAPGEATSDRLVEKEKGSGSSATVPTWRSRARWVVLSAVPSALSLGTTQHISTDIAAVPLLWIAPLALYLTSFIVAFSRRNPLSSSVAGNLLPIPAAAMVVVPLLGAPIWLTISIHLLLLFVAAVMCHARLAEERPSTRYLTEFYLLLSIGGALGGVFVSLLAPLLFDRVWEYPLAIVAALLLRPRIQGLLPRWSLIAVGGTIALAVIALLVRAQEPSVLPGWTPWIALAATLLALSRWRIVLAAVTAFLLGVPLTNGEGAIYTDRTFFGVYRVLSTEGRHELLHGTTVHGMQFLGATEREVPATYYHPTGPIGQVLTARGSAFKRIGVVGLGVGTLASYGTPGQHLTFFEIDPAMVALAREPTLFTYLADSEAEIDIRVADGRLGLVADTTRYDLLVVDAFSSDAIPVHLLTREALSIYESRLASGGVIAFHITNRYLDLAPVLGNIADSLGMSALVQVDTTLSAYALAQGKAASTWVLLAPRPADLAPFDTDARWTPAKLDPDSRVWTDGYSDLIGALH